MTVTITKVTATRDSTFPTFYLRADWAQASGTVQCNAGPSDATIDDLWQAMQPNQVADYGHDVQRAALAVIREWNEGIDGPEDFALEDVDDEPDALDASA
jgi:hypothetical protein